MSSDALSLSPNSQPFEVLLVEDNPGDVRLLREALAEADQHSFELAHAERLTQALDRLDQGQFDLILLDLSLPDSDGLETLARACEQAPGTAIIILTGTNNETLVAKAFEMGTQDYLVKGEVSSAHLLRVMRHAIERKRAQGEREGRLARNLQEQQDKVGVLSGLIGVCSLCNKVHASSGEWKHVGALDTAQAGTKFSEGLCPSCTEKFHPVAESRDTNSAQARVLFIEDNPGDVRLIREALKDVKDSPFILECVSRLSEGLERLAENEIDVVLLDLTLPDSSRLDTFLKVREQQPDMPVIVLTGIEEDLLGVKAMQAGAQDYMVKGHVDGDQLARAMRYAIERQRLKVELRDLSLVDGLTGLKNRRGFATLVEQQLKLTQTVRAKKGMLFLADMDGLKQINDSYGHQEGDRAISKIAEVLKKTFRGSDIVARFGGDEFVVFAIETSEYSAEEFKARLERNLQEANAQGDLPYNLSLSVGVAHVEPHSGKKLDELIAQADAAMYEHKRRVKKS